MRRVDSAGIVMAPLWQVVGGNSPGSEAGPADAPARRLEAEVAAAQEAGYRDGYAQGLKQAQEQVDRDKQAWKSRQQKELDAVRQQLETERTRWVLLAESLSAEMEKQAIQAEETAVSVAYAAIVKLLGDRYRDGEVMRDVVRSAMVQASHAIESVRVAEADAELLGDMKPILVVGDPTLAPGQCVLETRCGQYGTGLDVRLDSLKKALLSGLDRHRERGADE